MKELWEQALDLEHFIRDFIPAHWKEPIHMVMFVPFVSEQDIVTIQNGTIPEKFNSMAMLLAIRAWLLKGKDNGKVQPQ